MKCYVHSDVDPVGTCTSCGRGICGECAVEVQSQLVCRDCLAAGKVTARQYDPNTAFLIELIGGFFGLLGIGYIYVGRTNDGILRLVLWLLYDIIAAITISLLLAVIVGIVCIPFQLAIQIGVPLWSATTLKNELLSGGPV
jgi:TM2 domain-containing membrane protein YozV